MRPAMALDLMQVTTDHVRCPPEAVGCCTNGTPLGRYVCHPKAAACRPAA